jgi:hypothetical protein
MSHILPVFQNAKAKFKAEMTTGEMVHSPTTYMTIQDAETIASSAIISC